MTTRPTWTDITDGQVDIDSPITTTLMTALRDNAEAVRVQPIFYDSGGQLDETSTGFTTQYTFDVGVPDIDDYTGIQRNLTIEVNAWVDANQGEVRIRDNTNAVNGTASTVTATASGTRVSVPLDIAAAYAGTVVEIAVQSRVTTATTISVDDDAVWAGVLDY